MLSGAIELATPLAMAGLTTSGAIFADPSLFRTTLPFLFRSSRAFVTPMDCAIVWSEQRSCSSARDIKTPLIEPAVPACTV